MKKLAIFTVGTILAGFVFSSYGAPVRNHPQTLLQPDRSVVKCFVSGDEFNHWLHDKDNYAIVQNAVTGYFVYALLEGGRLVPSNFVVGKANPANLGLEKGARPSPAVMTENRMNHLMRKAAPVAQPARLGILNNIAVFIRFADESSNVFPDSTATYQRLFNSPEAYANSMRHYYEEVSYGKLTVMTAFFPVGGDSLKTYQDALPRDYYRKYDIVTNPFGYTSDSAGLARELSLLTNAVYAVTPDIPASLNIDANNDGVVDNICFIVSGDLEGWGDWVMWPHMGQFPPSTAWINGKEVKGYNVQLRDFLFRKESGGVSVLCHEFFHTLGAPDLYHYSGQPPDPVGPWDLMDESANPPVHMSAYMKYWYGGWIEDIPTISAPGTYKLSPLISSTGSCYRIPSPYSSSEDFILEYRTRTGVFESSLPGEGVLVYRIFRARVADNSTGPPDEVYLYRPGGTLTSEGRIDSAAMSAATGRVSLTDFTNPASFLSSGSAGGLNLMDVGMPGENISITLGERLLPTLVTTESGNVDVGGSSDTVTVSLRNPDPVPLSVVSVVQSAADHSLDAPALPVIMPQSASISLRAVFHPEGTGFVTDTIDLRGINPRYLLARVIIKGRGVIVPRARPNTLYAVTGAGDGGRLHIVDATNGKLRAIGHTTFSTFFGLRVCPGTHELMGVAWDGVKGNTLVRVNSETGEAYGLWSTNTSLGPSFAFRDDSTIITTNGPHPNLLQFSLTTKQHTSVYWDYPGMQMKILNGLAFFPGDHSRIWAVLSTTGSVQDSLCTINLTTRVTKVVGALHGGPFGDIVFDDRGTLFGVAKTDPNGLVRIDTSSGEVTVIGSMDVTSVVGLAAEGVVIGISDMVSLGFPAECSLQQNYPNPFNPSTTIKYELPKGSHVSLTVFDILGREVMVLVNERTDAGVHEVKFDGSGLASGVYFYRLQAGMYVDTKKLLLLR